MYLYIFIVHIQTKDRSRNCSKCYMTDVMELDALMKTPECAERGTEGMSAAALGRDCLCE